MQGQGRTLLGVQCWKGLQKLDGSVKAVAGLCSRARCCAGPWWKQTQGCVAVSWLQLGWAERGRAERPSEQCSAVGQCGT